MINKKFKYSEKTTEKILFGLINFGSFAMLWAFVSFPAMLNGLSRALNPPSAQQPLTLGDRMADVMTLPYPFLKYAILLGSIAAMAQSFLIPALKEKWLFRVLSVCMITFAVLFLGLGRL